MHDRAAHLMAHVFPDAPVRQWVLSPPSELVPLLAVRKEVLTAFMRSFVDAVSAEMKSRAASAGGRSLEFREASAPDEEMVFEVGRRVFARLERFLKREGYLDPTEGHAPEALDRWWMRATREPPVLPTRPRLVSTSDSELPGGFSIHAGVRIEGHRRR